MGSGFGVQGSGFRVQGSGVGVSAPRGAFVNTASGTTGTKTLLHVKGSPFASKGQLCVDAKNPTRAPRPSEKAPPQDYRMALGIGLL